MAWRVFTAGPDASDPQNRGRLPRIENRLPDAPRGEGRPTRAPGGGHGVGAGTVAGCTPPGGAGCAERTSRLWGRSQTHANVAGHAPMPRLDELLEFFDGFASRTGVTDSAAVGRGRGRGRAARGRAQQQRGRLLLRASRGRAGPPGSYRGRDARDRAEAPQDRPGHAACRRPPAANWRRVVPPRVRLAELAIRAMATPTNPVNIR